MSKFLPIGTKGELLNSDMIARIIPKEDGGCIILTKDGQHFHSEIDLHDEVNDYNSIRSIIPCQGVSAVYLDDDGDSEICPCAFVMLMSDGKIEPLQQTKTSSESPIKAIPVLPDSFQPSK
jgi:hypothetical protein